MIILFPKAQRTAAGTASRKSHPPVDPTEQPPLRATLLTLKLWLDRSIIILFHMSSPTGCQTGLTQCVYRSTQRKGIMAHKTARLYMKQMYPPHYILHRHYPAGFLFEATINDTQANEVSPVAGSYKRTNPIPWANHRKTQFLSRISTYPLMRLYNTAISNLPHIDFKRMYSLRQFVSKPAL